MASKDIVQPWHYAAVSQTSHFCHRIVHLGVCPARQLQASKLVEDVTSMQLTTSILPEKIIELASMMVSKGHWSPAQLALFTAWVDDLHNAGYDFPGVTAAVTSNQIEPTPIDAASDPDPQLWLDDGSLEHSFVFPHAVVSASE